MKEEHLINLPIEWKRGNGLRKSDLEDDGKLKCILYGELYTKHNYALIDNKDLSRTNKKGTFCSKKGDILVPGTSTASKKDMLLAREIDEDGVILGGDINVIRPQPGLFAKKYLPYFFDTFSAYDQLDRYITGATGIIHISNSGLKKLKVPLPTYEEQQRIVAILDKAFAAIDKAKANAEQNLKNAKELFESYLQGVFENGNWEKKELRELTTILGDGLHGTPKYSIDGDYYFINGNNLNDGVIEFKESTKRVNFEEYNKHKKNLNDRTVLVSINGTLGNVAFYNGEKVILGKSACYFNLKETIDKGFVKYVLSSPYFIKYAHKEATGATIKNVSLKSMREFKVPCPSLKDQQTIVRQLDALRAETQKLEAVYKKKIEDLDELKKSILQKAFNGELRGGEPAEPKTEKAIVI